MAETPRPEAVSEAVWATLDKSSRKQILAATRAAYQEGLKASKRQAPDFTALLHPHNVESMRTAQNFVHKVNIAC